MSARMRRVNESVRQVLSEALPELKDPRIGFVTITAVETSPDLRHARVFISVLGSERKRRATLAGLAAAHGVLQARVARELSPLFRDGSRGAPPPQQESGRPRDCCWRMIRAPL